MPRSIVAPAGLALAALLSGPAHAAEPADVLKTYADIALATYEDALASAQALDAAVDAFIAAPGEATLSAAREAWLAARPWYQQSEAFRFGNPIVDEFEGKVNAWPLDEGLIDYVAASYGGESDANAFYTLNIIANAEISTGGETLDATVIDGELILRPSPSSAPLGALQAPRCPARVVGARV